MPVTVNVPAKIEARHWWERVRRVEMNLARKLRRITKHIEHLVENFPTAGPDVFQADQVATLLDRYGKILEPWAAAEGERTVAEIARRDERAWFAASKKMARLIREEINDTPVGHVLQAQSKAVASLITSLPADAAQRVRTLTLEARASGKRPADLVAEIQASGEISQGRARLIARTEVARTASLLTQTRAVGVGSTHYIWRTVGDGDVRKSHRQMDGRVCEWAKPPTLSDGTTTHAGQIYNCRCFPEPIFEDE